MSSIEENDYALRLSFGDNWKPEWISHFKQQLMFIEVSGPYTRVLYNGGGHQTRHEIMVNSIREAVKKRPVSCTKRFYLFTGDSLPQNFVSEWKVLSTVGTRSDFDNIVPDAHSFAWPEIGVSNFSLSNMEMLKRSQEFLSQGKVLKKVYWRGLLSQNPLRLDFFNQVKENKNFDVLDTSMAQFKSMQDIGEYSVLVDLPGQGFSGRLKHIIFSGRPVVVYPRAQWDWASLQLEPGIHYILSMPSIDHLKFSCEIALDNPQIQNFFSNKWKEARNLLEKDTLHAALSSRINSCD